MAIFTETMRSRADAPDRSEPPDPVNAHGHELGHSAQPPRDPPADNVGTAAAALIITAKKRSRRRPGNGNAPKPSRCAGILLALLREGVSQPTWILQKELTESDVSSQQGRLLLSSAQVAKTRLRDLITSDEAALVMNRERGLPVRAFDRLGREHAMTFKFLDSNGDFRLIGSWGRFVKCIGLRTGDLLDVWAFRCRNGLGMALLDRKKKDDKVRKDDVGDKFDADELLAAEALVLLQDS